MKLFFSAGACSLAPHALLREMGQSFDLVRVNLKEHLTAEAQDYYAINPKGAVPAVMLDSGEVLTEVAVLLPFLAERFGHQHLLGGAAGSLERFRVCEWLNFIATEVHKLYTQLFVLQEAAPEIVSKMLFKKLDYLDRHLAQSGPYLGGTELSVADFYLFNVFRWTKMLKLDDSRWSALIAHQQLLRQRPSVEAAIAAELPPK